MTVPRTTLAVTVAAVVALAVWVGVTLFGPGSAPAVWRVAPGADLASDTTRIAVLVSRMGCNNGVTGEVLEPEVEESAEQVVVTFRVGPRGPSEASCPDNAEERYTLVLAEPLGERRLVDGECLGQRAGVGTSECRDQGIRHAP